jgi:hypothetical protein
VLRRQHAVGRAEQRVRPRGEHGERSPAARRRRRIDVRALAAADPVALHRLDALGPVEFVEVLEQALGVGGDRSIHCFIIRFSTGSPVSTYLPSLTSSLASTVPSAGHQFTGASAW